MATIITPRPPLNLFEAVRAEIGDTWTTLYDTPNYTIPANGPNPQRIVGAAAIMTGLGACPLASSGATVWARIQNETGTQNFLLANGMFAPAGDLLAIAVDRQVLKAGEKLQVKCDPGELAVFHFSFILNQREEFTEIPA